MALDNVVLTDAAAASQTFTLVGSVATDGRVLRKNLARPLETPVILTTSHATSGKGASTVDRHLSRLDRTELDADGVTPYTGSIYLVAVGPRRIITGTQMYDLWVQLKSRWANEAAFTAWLAGQL